MGGLAYSQQGLGPRRAAVAAASGLRLVKGLLGHYTGEWWRVGPTEDRSAPLLRFATPSQACKLGSQSAFLTRGSSTASIPKEVERQI